MRYNSVRQRTGGMSILIFKRSSAAGGGGRGSDNGEKVNMEIREWRKNGTTGFRA